MKYPDSAPFDDADVLSDSGVAVYSREPDELPSTSVIEAVADVTGTDTTALPSLYASIDTDALDDLVGERSESPTSGNVCITFRFAGCDVAVCADGRTIVSETPSHPP